ncbi:MAG: type IIA DNA topoisomerase subunit B [bacterium]|jgi:DNA gyrase subunit B
MAVSKKGQKNHAGAPNNSGGADFDLGGNPEADTAQDAAPSADVEVVEGDYGADQIQVLKGLAGVRHRPAMYIGSTGEAGLHHLVYEIVDNAIDEVMAGHAKNITVEILTDRGIRVTDDGRGIPVDVMESEGKSALEVILTTLHAGGKFGGGAYKVSGGLHGVGASVVNALSQKYITEVHRDGVITRIVCERGEVTEPVKVSGKTRKRGTVVTFWPDPDVFETTDFKFPILEERLRELAFLNAGLKIDLIDHRDGEKASFKAVGGLGEFVKWLNRNRETMHKPVMFEHKINSTRIEVSLQFTTGYNERILGFANNIFTKDGGTHIVGFKTALTRVVNNYAKKNDLYKANEEVPSGDDVREGVTAVVSVWLEHPQFEGQTKSQLGNTDVQGMVEVAVGEHLSAYFDENPPIAKKIVAKAQASCRARLAAKRARDIARKKAGFDSSLPGKLADCAERDNHRTELFIVEGDSAAGPAKNGRDRNFQAILPIRGKILNVEKAGDAKMLNNALIRDLITAIGTNIGQNFDLENRRYDKTIILTDADVDGSHIQILLLTFFFNHMRELIEAGHVFIAKNPLYCVKKGQKRFYVMNDAELKELLKEIGEKGAEITRFKGLGEMNADQLWETTMNPESRTLLKVTIDDAAHAETVFTNLMGNEVAPRKKFITDYAREVKNLDI